MSFYRNLNFTNQQKVKRFLIEEKTTKRNAHHLDHLYMYKNKKSMLIKWVIEINKQDLFLFCLQSKLKGFLTRQHSSGMHTSQMNKFEQVSSDCHHMSVAGEG